MNFRRYVWFFTKTSISHRYPPGQAREMPRNSLDSSTRRSAACKAMSGRGLRNIPGATVTTTSSGASQHPGRRQENLRDHLPWRTSGVLNADAKGLEGLQDRYHRVQIYRPQRCL
ncbi:uncharacterized protein LOC144883087 isoform X2 [Branchiostoma floridae x Branchiostoma japonicum]